MEPLWIVLVAPSILLRDFLWDPWVQPWIVAALFLFWPLRWWHTRRLAPPTRMNRPLALLLLWLPVTLWASSDVERSWAALGYRCLVPMFDAAGELVSLRARNVTEGEPKALPPKGWTAKGMVMANPLGRMMLDLGAWPWWAERKVVICEGEPDWLTWATRDAGTVAVLGIAGSGGWAGELAARVPGGSRVVVRTDEDDAGDRYAEHVAASLQGLCTVLETKPSERAARRATRPERERAKRTAKGFDL